MGLTLSIIIVIVAVLLILVVLIQNSKGGGLASNFSAPSQVMGVKKTNDFIEKATWGLAITMLVLSIGASYMSKTPTATTAPQSQTQGHTEQFQDDAQPASVGGVDENINQSAPSTVKNDTSSNG